MVVALKDLLRGGDRLSVMAALRQFKEVVDANNQYHPGTANQFAVAPLVMPPRLCWYEDNPPPGPPSSYANRLNELQMLNQEIEGFNTQSGIANVPHLNLLGARRYKMWYEDGTCRQVVHHRMGQWRESEERFDKLHLKDSMRIRMASMVQDYFLGEVQRNGSS